MFGKCLWRSAPLLQGQTSGLVSDEDFNPEKGGRGKGKKKETKGKTTKRFKTRM
jgi:hypothetical protein